MNSFIEFLNQRGGSFLNFAWPMLWQSSLLIVVLFAFDFLFRRKVRASIRYALWLVVLVKLCVPPMLALPTSPAWWLHKTPPPIAAKAKSHYTVTYDNSPLPETPPAPLPASVPPKPTITNAAWLLVTSTAVSSALLGWLLVRWGQITRQIRRAKPSKRLAELSGEAQTFIGTKFKVQVKLTTNSMSPAVCGLFRPTILIPQSLVENFWDEQLRAVLMHELIHLRRRDVWVNFVQALLQIIYWWHPLVWLANARIRRVREEAVDDAVMLALRDDAESYASTLLEVAKLAFNGPLASLGLVGILESRHALRQRIERLVDFHPPSQAGLTLASLLGILAFTAVAVPMGQAPVASGDITGLQSLTVKVNPEVFLHNLTAQAGNYMRATNEDYIIILTDILRGEGVDGVPPHAFDFNINAGEMTAKNSPEALEIFRQIIEQLNRADGKGVPFLPESSYHRSFHPESVLINAEFYFMRSVEFGKVVEHLDSLNYDVGNSFVGTIGAAHFAEFDQRIKALGLNPFAKPRVETGHGIGASMFCGIGTNGVHFDCLPYINEKGIELAFRANVLGDLSGDATTLVGPASSTVSGRVMAENHGGIIVCANNPDGSVKSNLVVVLQVQIVTNSPPVNAGRIGQTDSATGTNADTTNVTGSLNDPDFRVVLNALKQRTGSETLPEPEVITTSGRGVNRIRMDNISAPLSQTDNSQLVQDAKLDYEMGKLDDAEKLLKSALSRDAQNNAAKYYLGLVQTARQYPMTSPIKTGRQKIVEKLEQIQLDSFGPFMGVSLAEVVRQLNEMARQNDPEKIGVDIAILTNSFSDQPPAIDSVVINLTSPLMNIKLRDALDAIPMVADKPIMYSVMDGSIVFSMKDTSEIPTLYSRHFRVGNSSFVSALKKKTGLETNNVSQMASIFLSKIGVDLNMPGKSVFFNDGLGELFVRATATDLDTVKTALEAFKPVEPQIHIKARFLEVPKGTLDVLANVTDVPDQSVRSNQVAGLVGILTDKNFKTVLHNLEARPGIETLTESEVVTTSGRQTQMRATTVITVITNFALQVFGTNLSIYPQTNSVELGPVLDTIPYVLSDDHTINLTLTAQLTGFLGYDQPPTNAVSKYIKEYDVTLPMTLPSFHVQQASTSVNLWDNQTVVLGKLQQHFYDGDEEVAAEPDYFVKTKKSRGQPDVVDKELLVFLTVTLVDPAGNRVHSDEEMPFTRDAVPSQPPQ